MKDWTQITANIQPGDVICVRHLEPEDIIADAIEWFQNGDVSHTVTCLGDGTVVNAQPTGIKQSPLTDFLLDNYQLTLRRLPVDGAGQKIADVARTHIGRDYDFKTVAVDAVYGILGKMGLRKAQVWVGKRIHGSRRLYTCSEEFAVSVWKAVGVDLSHGMEFDLVLPHDVLVSPLLKTVSLV